MALLMLVVLGLGYVARLHALRVEFARGTEHAHRLHKELEGKALRAGQLGTVKASLDRLRQQLQDTRWRLAAGGDMAELLEDLSRLGHEQGLVFEQVDVLKSTVEPGYRTVPLKLQVIGRYPALRVWLDQWLGQLRLLRVQQLRLDTVKGEPGLLRMHLQVNTFHAGQDAIEVPRSLAAEPARAVVSAPVIDPFRRSSGSATANPLVSVPLEQLEMVGSLASQGEHQALLRLDGTVHRVRRGDRVGRADGRVIRIDDHQVEVLERSYVGGQGWLEQSRYLALRKRAVTEITDEHESNRAADVAGDPAGTGHGGDADVRG
ncbi:MAG TPA: pilus assembly protein PilP [Pseudomonas sp.]|uniref:pilus assembly protein PilP n=1 Tax=Pseudomonas sp. TaxID=306 RepID=UPI002B46BCBD|nr:pilus assembly protein PilP [Pseudomonas sp.]HKS14822.1 pilus assembly protein PilP [Pseudomonas sp.]